MGPKKLEFPCDSPTGRGKALETAKEEFALERKIYNMSDLAKETGLAGKSGAETVVVGGTALEELLT